MSQLTPDATVPESRRGKFIFVFLFCMAAAMAIALSSYHEHLNADTLITYLVSLIKWTPFYWGQDRYGMLIPGLTAWIKIPILNMVVQSAMHVATSFVTFFLLAKALKFTHWIEAGALAAIFYCALSGVGDFVSFFSPWQIYTPAMMFGLLALWCAEKSWIASLLCLIIAQWCNFSVNILLAILILALSLEQLGRDGWKVWRKGLIRHALLLGASSIVGYFLRLPFATTGSSAYSMASWKEGLTGWIEMLVNYRNMTQYSMWMLLLPPALVLVVRFIWRVQFDPRQVRTAVAALVALWLYGFVIGASVFAKLSGYPPRYLIPSIVIWLVVWAGFVVQLVPTDWIASKRLRGVFAMMILATIMVRFGLPSMYAVERALNRRLGPAYEEVQKANCTHVVGDYYRVWENVFYSYIKGEHILWGITFRSEVTYDKWTIKKFSDPHICYWQNNELEARLFLDKLNISDMTRVESRGNVTVLTRGHVPQ